MARFDVRAWPFKLAGFALLAGACNQMLDIEPASIDPRLTAAGRGGGAAHPAATGGASATGGSETAGTRPGSTDTGGTGAVGSGSGATSGTHEHTSSGGSNATTGGASSTSGGDAGSAQAPSSGGSGGSGTHGGGSDTSGGSGDAGAAGETGAPVDLCDQYCDLMEANCSGNDEQYRDRDQCEKICHLLPAGAEGDADDDSIACRLKYVDKMRYANGSELSVYCHQAGPGGDGRCGSVCEAYCALMAEVCTADTAGAYHFASDSDCMKTCNALPAAPVAYSSTNPEVSDGNHALCRLFHVTSAAMADADEHCEHAMGVTLCEAASP
jgi:hypothetical protein